MESVAHLLNSCEVGHDGRTAYERFKGKKAHLVGVEFGESVHWKERQVGGALCKSATTSVDGVFLGIEGKTGELIAGTARGVWKSRIVQRKPFEDRWKKDIAELAKARPYSAEHRDRDGRPWAAPCVDGQEELNAKNVVCDDAREPMPRNFASKREYVFGVPGVLCGVSGLQDGVEGNRTTDAYGGVWETGRRLDE